MGAGTAEALRVIAPALRVNVNTQAKAILDIVDYPWQRTLLFSYEQDESYIYFMNSLYGGHRAKYGGFVGALSLNYKLQATDSV